MSGGSFRDVGSSFRDRRDASKLGSHDHRSVAAPWLCRSPLRLPRYRGPVGRAALASGAFRVFPNSDSTFRAIKTVRVASLMDLASSSKRLAPDRSSEPLRSAGLYRANTARPTCLSWELFSRVPRFRQPSTASTPGTDVAVCSFGRPLPQGRHVPLSWFCTTSAVYSALEARVYCNPMPDEVRRVSRLPSSARPEPPERGACRAKVRGPLPATLFTPFEDTHAEPR